MLLERTPHAHSRLQLLEETMILNRNLMFALTVAGGAAIAAVVVAQRNARRLEAEQHQRDLQVWENETGSVGSAMAPAVAKPLP